MPAKKAPTATIMDVAKPGKTPPSASGVPIIVTLRPIMKDPMVVDSEAKDTGKTDDTPLKTGKTIRIEPIVHDDDKPTAVKTATTAKAAAKPVAKAETEPAATGQEVKILSDSLQTEEEEEEAEKPVEKTIDAPAAAQPEAASTENEQALAETPKSPQTPELAADPEASPEAAAAADIEPKPEPVPAAGDSFQLAEEGDEDDQSDPSKHPMDEAQQKADKEAAEKAAAFEKLVDGQTYFLPINAVEKRRVRHVLLGALLLVVVLAIAGAVWSQSTGLLTLPGF